MREFETMTRSEYKHRFAALMSTGRALGLFGVLNTDRSALFQSTNPKFLATAQHSFGRI